MRPAKFYLVALLLLSSSLTPLPQIPDQTILGGQVAKSSRDQPAPDARTQVEEMDQLLREMQALSELTSINSRQRSEIKTLMRQIRNLRQQARDHADPDWQLWHQKKLQEIQLRLDAIKSRWPQRPGHIKKYPIAIVFCPTIPGAPLLTYPDKPLKTT